MKKFTDGGLSDSETRMVPYGKLSDKRKAEIKSQYEKDAKEAGANVKRPFGSKVLDAYYEMNPLVSEKQRQSVRSDAAEDVAQRQRKFDYAEGRLKSLGTRKEYFSDDAPHKIDPNEKLFKRGGDMGAKKPNPFMEMIAKKKEMAAGKKSEMPMKKMAKGGGIESKGKTKGTVIKMANGGSVSARADGIAQRGKTKFTMC